VRIRSSSDSRRDLCVRDPWGLRPLCLGELNHGVCGYAVASEVCALATIGARFVREVQPGEIVRIDSAGLTSRQGHPAKEHRALCIFEYVYFRVPIRFWTAAWCTRSGSDWARCWRKKRRGRT
jgi:glutamine phosphoribosylpyrophosphate amidotransferase